MQSNPSRKRMQVSGLARWLLEAGPLHGNIGDLHTEFCHRLAAGGLPIWRSSLGLEVLHPEISGSQFVWADETVVTTLQVRAGVMQAPSYLNSPTRVVDETGRAFRQRLGDDVPDMPLLQELKASGGTDYIILPLHFIDQSRTAFLSFATRAPAGFSRANLRALDLATRLFAPYAERWVLRRVAIDLLDTYVGPRSGQRIFHGQIERGQVDTIEAAIWLADMRGFTRMSAVEPVETVIGALNDWLDVMVDAIEAHDGEVLKFMGDGVLAIFPSAESGPRAACGQALQAARDVCRSVDGLNAVRASAGSQPLEFGLGLHVGEVAYGNVGGKRRLDFTVIGSAVNYASRLQDLTKTMGCRVLASGAFQAMSGGGLRSLGPHTLPGVAGAHEVFTI